MPAFTVVGLPDKAVGKCRAAEASGYHRVLRVAHTLADLDGAASVCRIHVAEALSYRRVVAGA